MNLPREERTLPPSGLPGVPRRPAFRFRFGLPFSRLVLTLAAGVTLAAGCGSGSPAAPEEPAPTGPGTSRGMVDDPQVRSIPPGATRHFFAGPTLEASVRPNALGDAQVLYYDVYAPTGPPLGITVIYLHGGGYNVGYANNQGIVGACRHLGELGAWCISVEYRRGWHGGGSSAVAGTPITATDRTRFDVALELARTDVLDGWAHAHAEARGIHGFPGIYVVMGESAGGSLASRVTLTNPSLGLPVVGVIVGFGTHGADEPVMQSGFPVVIQGGLFDPIQPAYDAPLYFSPEMPPAKGLFTLYEELRGRGAPARLLLGAQDGHGFGSYARSGGGGDHYAEALAFFRDVARGETLHSWVEYRFRRSDPRVPEAGAGVRIRTTDRPGFRYEPYQSELAAGAHPDSVRARWGLE